MNPKYNKFFVALAGLVVGLLMMWLGNDNQVVLAVIQLATALGVYGVANK